jgi:hypothetical protein
MANGQEDLFMKSRKIIVPRILIKKFYPHPDDLGDGSYFVDLVNGRYTDLFYREEGDFVTVTNENALISYLRKNQMKPREYFFRNGVFSFHNVLDCDSELIQGWNEISPISVQLVLPKEHNLPSEFMFCFYWIEVGRATIKENRMTLDIYEIELIHKIDIGVALDLLMEYLNKSDPR